MSHNNQKTVERLFDTICGASPDYDALADLFAENAHYWALVPVSPLRQGPQAIVADIKKQFGVGGDLTIEPHAIVASGRHVVFERTDTITVPPERRVPVRICGIFEFDDDGKIVSWREYWDSEECRLQMGLTMEQLRAAII